MKLTGYKHLKKLYAGPLWTHYEAVDAVIGTRVWLLVFSLSAQAEHLEALQTIVRDTSLLNHPNILVPIAARRIENTLCLIFPAFMGESLFSLITRGIPIVERRATAVIKQTAAALQFARIRGICHGHLSPELIFLLPTSEEVKIIGFGIGRFLSAFFRRPNGAANHETFRELDDAFGLGAIAYQMLSGKLLPDLTPETVSLFRPLKEINPKLSPQVSDLVCSLTEPEEHRRAPISRVTDLLLRQPEEDGNVEEKQEKKGVTAVFAGFLEQLKSLHMHGSRKRTVIAVTLLTLAAVVILSSVLMRFASGGAGKAHPKEYFEFIKETRDAAPRLLTEERPNMSEPSALPTLSKPIGDEQQKEIRVERNSRVFDFERPIFADRIQIDHGPIQPLPASMEIPFGKRRLAFYDSEYGLVWETTMVFGRDSGRSISFSADEIGKGELRVVLKDAEKHGYVFVAVDGEKQMTTPCRVQLSAGRRHVRMYRQSMTVVPAETVVFISPIKLTTIVAKISQDSRQ